MPIRPENKARYPKNWNEISQRIRHRAGNHCEWCGAENHARGGRDSSGKFHKAVPRGESLQGLMWPALRDYAMCEDGHRHYIIRIVLTVAHIDHTPENCSDDNLAALCQRCHNRHDAKMRAAGRRARARAALNMEELPL